MCYINNQETMNKLIEKLIALSSSSSLSIRKTYTSLSYNKNQGPIFKKYVQMVLKLFYY